MLVLYFSLKRKEIKSKWFLGLQITITVYVFHPLGLITRRISANRGIIGFSLIMQLKGGERQSEMGNRSSDQIPQWIIPKPCLFVFVRGSDGTWACGHRSMMWAPSDCHPAQLHCSCSVFEAEQGLVLGRRYTWGISLSTCNPPHFGESHMPVGYSPSTSAKVPQTQGLALGSEVIILPASTSWIRIHLSALSRVLWSRYPGKKLFRDPWTSLSA